MISDQITQTKQASQGDVDRLLLSRVLLGAGAAGGLSGLLKGYLSYLNASVDEDKNLSDSVSDLQIPLSPKAQKVRRARNKLDPSVFMEPKSEEGEGELPTSFGEPTTASQSSDELVMGGWGESKAASEGYKPIAIGNPSLQASVLALPLAVAGYQGSEHLFSKILSTVKKREIRRQLAEAEAAHLRALEEEKQQLRTKTAAEGDRVNTWTTDSVVGLLALGMPGLLAYLSGKTTDRLLSGMYPSLKRELPTSHRVKRIELPSPEVLEEDGEPAENFTYKTAAALTTRDADEFLFRVAMEMPSVGGASLRDLVKCAAAGGTLLLEEALAGSADAMWKFASKFRRLELEPAETALGLSLLSRSACHTPAMLQATAVLHDHAPTMHKSARKLSEADASLASHAEGAGACMGAMLRIADLQGVLDIPDYSDELEKRAASTDRWQEIDLINTFLTRL